MPRVVSLFLPAWSTDRLKRILGGAAPPDEAPFVLTACESIVAEDRGRPSINFGWTLDNPRLENGLRETRRPIAPHTQAFDVFGCRRCVPRRANTKYRDNSGEPWKLKIHGHVREVYG